MTRHRVPRADVLLVAPLPKPPLLGGIETGVALHLQSELAQRVTTRLFNTARERDPSRRIDERLLYQVTSCVKFTAAVARVRPKVVHIKAASGINFYQCVLYGLLARCLGRRLVLQLHAGDFPTFYSRAGALGQLVIRIGLRLPHGLIVLSDYWARYFRSISNPRHIAIIPNATLTRRFAHASGDRSRFGLPVGRTIVLFVGTRSPDMDREKGLPDLIEAVGRIRREYSHMMLALAGRCVDRESLTNHLGPEGAGWKHVGVIREEDKPDLYRSVDVFALPSKFENMPNTVLEAMAAGLPVVASSVGALPEMLENGKSGILIPAQDVEALVGSLRLLGGNPELRRRIGAAAAARAREEYDFDRLQERMLVEYIRVAGLRVAAPTEKLAASQ